MTVAAATRSVPDARTLARALAARLPDSASSFGVDARAPMLELSPPELPRVIAAPVVEGDVLRARPIRATDQAVPAFAGFLDGTQSSVVLRYVDCLPIIFGTVAAVVRERRDRRLTTWRHTIERRVYAPCGALSREAADALEHLAREQSVDLVDTSAPSSDDRAPEHPYLLRDAAIQRVRDHRADAEQRLAEAWSSARRELLFIDGGISASKQLASSDCVAGVIKSHRTLYAEGGAMQTVLSLAAGERSSVFRVTSPKRAVVESWYLRLRDPRGHDPMWGLVRVEIAALDGTPPGSLTVRADAISAAILAEVAPAALPDPRWHAMVYGILDCEQFLKALT